MAKRILVVEDNEDNLLIVATILRHYDYEVITAVDGEAALALAHSAQPDLILLDIAIPLLNGWDVAASLQSDPSTTDIPIVAFTAHADSANRTRAQEAGLTGFLTKPLAPSSIVREVLGVIGPAQELRSGL